MSVLLNRRKYYKKENFKHKIRFLFTFNTKLVNYRIYTIIDI